MDTAAVWSAQVRGFRLALMVEGLRPHTIRNYVGPVERFAQELSDTLPQRVSPADIRLFTASLQERVSAKTVHEAQRGLRRFFRFLLEEAEIKSDPMREMKLVRYHVAPQPTYTEAEVKRLLLVLHTPVFSGIGQQGWLVARRNGRP